MSNRSLRGSTRNSSLATASLVAQQTLSRALADSALTVARQARLQRLASVGDGSSNGDSEVDGNSISDSASCDNTPASDTGGFRLGGPSPVRSPPKAARFLAPARNASLQKKLEGENSATASTAREKSTKCKNNSANTANNADLSKNGSMSISAAYLIDEAVRKAYRKLVKRRDSKQKKLIQSVLSESRDQVISKNLSKRRNESNHFLKHTPYATLGKEANEETRQSKNKRKPTRGEINLREKKRAKKTMKLDYDNGINQSTFPKASQNEEEKKNDDDVDSSSRLVSSERVGNDDSFYAMNIGATSQTLIFPRLPCNDDNIHSFFTTPFCRPCEVKTSDDDWNNKSNNSDCLNENSEKDATIIATDKAILFSSSSSKPTITFASSNSSSDDSSSVHDNETSKSTNKVENASVGLDGTTKESANVVETSQTHISSKVFNTNQDPKYDITISSRGPNSRSINSSSTYQPLLIEGVHPPRPASSSCIYLKSLFFVEDERNLAYIPYFGDDDKEDVVSQLVALGGDAEERTRMAEFGPPYKERETFDTIDGVLKLLAEQDHTLFDNADLLGDIEKAGKELAEGVDNEEFLQDMRTLGRIHEAIADLAQVRVERVRERHQVCFERYDNCDKSNESGENEGNADSKPLTKAKSAIEDATINGDAEDSQLETEQKNNSETPVPISYGSAMDSYRDLFCRRCFTYDCNLHGNIPKASLELLGELAVQKDKEGHWNELDKDIYLDKIMHKKKAISKANAKEKELTPIQKSICERAHLIFQGDVEKMANAIGSSPEAVSAYVSLMKMEIHAPQLVNSIEKGKRKKKDKTDYTSMKNYNVKWLNRIQRTEIHPSFIPCDHEEPCNDDTCSCVQNAFFCTKHCGWGSKSRNFFRGCSCKGGQCRSNSCACYAAKRECDPDLCRTCGACTDPPNLPAGDGQRCRNDSLSMRRHAHLLRAESSIKDAGFGVYTKHALKKGEFVHEYVGEVISQEEAERRGIIYDKLNMSYLFNLSSDFVVDASRKGNKTRYINHSSNPNCEPKMITVNGDIRIGLFAKEDIDAQSELFFDYRYDDHMENDLIIKPAYNVDWMKNPKMANKISKKHA